MAALFQQRHFEAIAEVCQEITRYAHSCGFDSMEDRPTGKQVALYAEQALTNLFARSNGMFNRERFARACVPGANVKNRINQRARKKGLTTMAKDYPTRMYALITAQGTAAGENALCDLHLDKAGKGIATQFIFSDVIDRETWHECSENDALYCAVCGWNVAGGWPVE